MQIKMTLRFHLTPMKITKINNTSASSGCGINWNIPALLVEVQNL